MQHVCAECHFLKTRYDRGIGSHLCDGTRPCCSTKQFFVRQEVHGPAAVLPQSCPGWVCETEVLNRPLRSILVWKLAHAVKNPADQVKLLLPARRISHQCQSALPYSSQVSPSHIRLLHLSHRHSHHLAHTDHLQYQRHRQQQPHPRHPNLSKYLHLRLVRRHSHLLPP